VLVVVAAAGTAVCFAELLVEVVPLDIAVHHLDLDLVDIVGFVAADLVVDPDLEYKVQIICLRVYYVIERKPNREVQNEAHL